METSEEIQETTVTGDDDMVMVIVMGDGDEITWKNGEEICLPTQVKEETLIVEEMRHILAATEFHGQEVKLEYEKETSYYNEEDFTDPSLAQGLINIKQEESDEEEDYEVEVLDDNAFQSSENLIDPDKDSDKKARNKKRKRNNRYTLSPAERHSFIEDLRQKYPELAKNEKVLISTVAEIMRNVKPPSLPNEFCSEIGTAYGCNTCEAVSTSFPAAGRHWQEKHGPRYLVCFACGVNFRSTTNLYKHEKRCSAIPDAIIVLKARALFLGRKARGRPFIPHLSTIPQLKPKTQRYPCSECSATFTSKASRTSHENMHRGLRPYWCDKCPSRYTNLSSLMRHRQKHLGEVFICDTCSMEFKTKSAIVAHLQTHNPVRKFPCMYDDCARRFSSKSALNYHVRREHLNLPMPFACQVCPARYPRMSLLRVHMKKHHGMAIMTRKMFFKALPRLTDAQVHQAKVILKRECTPLNLSANLDRMEDGYWQSK